MGFFDFLFRRSKTKNPPVASVATGQADHDVEDEEDEQTVFVSMKMSPRAQASTKRLRELNHQGFKQYRWVAEGAVCEVCQPHVEGGPFAISAGLTRAAPIPGREQPGCDECPVRLEGV